MSATVNQFTTSTIAHMPYDLRSVTFGAVAIIVLSLFLIEKEMIRLSGHPWGRRSQQGLNMAVAPLLIAFGAIVVVRLAVAVFHHPWS